MPEPVTKTEIGKAVQGWEKVRPAGEDYLVGDSEERAARMQDLRRFVGLMEARPDLPLPRFIDISLFLSGTGSQIKAQLDYASQLLGQPTATPYRHSSIRRVTRDLGSVEYRIVGIPPLDDEDLVPAFSVGQEVQLTAGAAHVAETARLAQAGTVVGIEPAPEGTFTYTVHFPGRVGTQRGWTEGMLRKAPPFDPPLTTSAGEIVSLCAAEELLIERGAEIKLQALSARQPSDTLLGDHHRLTDAVSQVCGLSASDLLHQIRPQVEEKVRSHVTAHGLEAPPAVQQLAAGSGHATATVEDIPVQGGGRQAPQGPAITPGQGKDR